MVKKNPKNRLFQNQESFEAESWYIASGTQGQPSLLPFDFFYSKVSYIPILLYWESVEKSLSQNVLKTNG